MINKILGKFRITKLAKTGAKYSMTATIASVVSMMVSLLNMRWLGPSELGIWQSLCVFTSYVPFLQLGVQSGLNVELPILLGKNDEDRVRRYISNAYYMSIVVSSLIVVVGTIATVFVWSSGMGLKYVFGVLALTAVNLANSVSYHFVARYRSSMSFDILTNIIQIQIIVAILCIPLIFFFGFWGLLIYNAAPLLVHAGLMLLRSPFSDVKPSIERDGLLYLIKRGVILMLFGQTSTAIKTFQQIFLLRFGGTIFVGLFSPALAIGNVLNLLPSQFAQFLVPQMGYKYGNTGQARVLWPYVKKILTFVPIMILPFSIGLAILLPWLINTFFPKYIESINAMQIMAFGYMFSCSSITVNFLYTLKAYKDAAYILVTEFLCYLILPTFFYKIIDLPILISISIGVTLTFLMVYIVTFVVMRITLFRNKYNNGNNTI